MTKNNNKARKTPGDSGRKSETSAVDKAQDNSIERTKPQVQSSRTHKDSAGEAQPVQKEKVQQTTTVSHSGRGFGGGLSVLALIISSAALSAAGFLWYEKDNSAAQYISQQSQFMAAQKSVEQLIGSQYEQVQSSELLKIQLQQQNQQLQQQTQQLQQQSVVIAEYDEKLAQINDQMVKLQQKLLPEMDVLLLARVRNIIYQAQSIIAVSRQNTGYVRDLLLEAQSIIVAVNDPLWDKLRQALVVDIDALGAVEAVNIITIFAQIEQVRRSVRTLEFISKDPQTEADKDDSEPLDSDQAATHIRNFANKIAHQLKNMIVIRENEGGIAMQMNTDAFQHTKLLLESGLSQSQLGLLQQDRKTFEQSLIQVRQTMEQRLGNYKLDKILAKIDEMLATRLFDVPEHLESYPVLKILEEELR